MLCIVVKSQGSSPGKQGFKMIVKPDGTFQGTIGGGIMEHKVKEEVTELFTDDEPWISVRKLDHHTRSSKENQSGLICSGTQTVVLVPLFQQDKTLVDKIVTGYDTRQPKELHINKSGIKTDNATPDTPAFFWRNEETKGTFEYIERVADPHTVYIFGAGHVGSAISSIMIFLDFYVVLLDNRQSVDFPIDRDFHEFKQGQYHQEVPQLKLGANAYAVVATNAMDNDKLALEYILEQPFKYIGLMGSRSKIRRIFEYLREKGISQEKLDTIHAPIGIKIANETPQEIAVSVAAELINLRNEKS